MKRCALEAGREGTALDILQALKGLGVTLVMDDFGMGYYSITKLRSFLVDALKIDQAIVEGVDKASENRAMVSVAISVAHAVRLEEVAEVVEAAGELDKLRPMGCVCPRLLLAEVLLLREDGGTARGTHTRVSRRARAPQEDDRLRSRPG